MEKNHHMIDDDDALTTYYKKHTPLTKIDDNVAHVTLHLYFTSPWNLPGDYVQQGIS